MTILRRRMASHHSITKGKTRWFMLLVEIRDDRTKEQTKEAWEELIGNGSRESWGCVCNGQLLGSRKHQTPVRRPWPKLRTRNHNSPFEHPTRLGGTLQVRGSTRSIHWTPNGFQAPARALLEPIFLKVMERAYPSRGHARFVRGSIGKARPKALGKPTCHNFGFPKGQALFRRGDA